MKSKIAENALKLYYFTKREGVGALARRGYRAAFSAPATYDRWKQKHRLSENALLRQKNESSKWAFQIDIVPFFSGERCPLLEKSLERQSAHIGILQKDYRNGKGEFILLAGFDAYLSANALYEFGRYIEQFPLTDWFYCDHDVQGQKPLFKPDFNENYLLSCPYIGPVVIVRRKILEDLMASGLSIPFGNMYRLQLNLADFCENIGHIPKILYRLKSSWPSQTMDGEIREQLISYFKEKKVDCTVTDGIAPGTYDVAYKISPQPLVSVIIPNKNHPEDLKKCIASLLEQNYKNLEIIIVENNSYSPETFKLYENLRQYNNINILEWNHPFNYSAINNFAADHASGEYLLFLNNDIEFIETQSIMRMVSLGEHRKADAVGIKLLYPDGSIQHAGVIVGYGGIAGHAFLGCDGSDHGYMNRIDCVQNYSAVTAACMLVRRSTFVACQGFDEEIQVAFNDVDFCLRLQAQGFHVVYTPYASAWHYESKSRGREDTFEKMRRFNREVNLFCRRWKCIIKQGDKAYNPNLSLEKWDFSIKL